MSAAAVGALLNEIAYLGEQVLCTPWGDIPGRRERHAELSEQVAEELKTGAAGAARLLVDGFAPLLLQALDITLRRLALRDCDSDWLSLVGFLIPKVHDAAGRAFDMAKPS